MAGIAQIISGLDALDQRITLSINGLSCDWSNVIWQFFSEQSVWYGMYLIVAFFIFKESRSWKKALIYCIGMILAIVICDQFSNIIKDLVCRKRPCHNINMIYAGLNVLEGKGGQYGFFSAHAANSFSFAVCSSNAFNKLSKKNHTLYTAWIFLWAFLVSASRIFVGKHYFGDVLVGAIIGITVGYLISKLSARITKRI